MSAQDIGDQGATNTAPMVTTVSSLDWCVFRVRGKHHHAMPESTPGRLQTAPEDKLGCPGRAAFEAT